MAIRKSRNSNQAIWIIYYMYLNPREGIRFEATERRLWLVVNCKGWTFWSLLIEQGNVDTTGWLTHKTEYFLSPPTRFGKRNLDRITLPKSDIFQKQNKESAFSATVFRPFSARQKLWVPQIRLLLSTCRLLLSRSDFLILEKNRMKYKKICIDNLYNY